MKKLTIVVALILLTLTLQAQNAYYDALLLERHLSGDDLSPGDDSIYFVLDRYIEPDKPTDRNVIKNRINDIGGVDGNPFLEIGGGGQSGMVPPGIIKGIRSIGDLNVTNLADALAQFLIERSKQELSVAFFDKFKTDLKKYPELKVLFPTTAVFIGNIEAYNYASFIQTLREAFHVDLAALPSGLRNLRRLKSADCPAKDEKCAARLEAIEKFFEQEEMSILFVASTIIMDSLRSGSSFADILHAVAADDQLAVAPQSNISNGLYLADIFSASLRSKDPEKIWITQKELKRLRDVNVLRMYFGLIYEQCKAKNIQFKVGESTVPLISLIKPDDVQKYFSYLENIISTGSEANRLAQEIRTKRKESEKFTADDYIHYLNASVDVVNSLVDWTVFKDDLPWDEFQKIVAITRAASSIYYNVRSDNYASAISNAFIIMEETMGERYKHKEELLRYGSFMASVVQAESSEEVKKAIEAVALPAGSASIKKNSQWNIGLNAYLGGFAGEEYLAEKTAGKWGSTSGVAAPIGLALSHRIGTASLTAFVSVLDIGAVASYRLKDSTTEELPELKLQNIFAPGWGAILGVPKWPVSIGYMWQAGPALREIDASTTTVSDSLNKRWYFFLGVDIPIVNFYTKPKAKN